MGCQSTKPGAQEDDRLIVVNQCADLMKQGKFLEALEHFGPDVTWQPFNGPVISGRDNLQAHFENNRKEGIKRHGLTPWWMEGTPSQDGKSYVAKRQASYQKAEFAPFKVLQTMEVKNGLISKTVVEAAKWEPNLEPEEVLSRFASLRAQSRNEDAVKCLARDCEWKPFDCPEIFAPPDELKEVLKDLLKIQNLLNLQAERNVVREAKSDWQAGDVSMLGEISPKAGGKVFFRKLVISCGGISRPFLQVAQVHSGQIVTIIHNTDDNADHV